MQQGCRSCWCATGYPATDMWHSGEQGALHICVVHLSMQAHSSRRLCKHACSVCHTHMGLPQCQACMGLSGAAAAHHLSVYDAVLQHGLCMHAELLAPCAAAGPVWGRGPVGDLWPCRRSSLLHLLPRAWRWACRLLLCTCGWHCDYVHTVARSTGPGVTCAQSPLYCMRLDAPAGCHPPMPRKTCTVIMT
jgi:hypothetical protein